MNENPVDTFGMTEAQWEEFQAFTNGFGEQDENGVDISLLRENLKLTPIQRLRKLQSAHEFFVKAKTCPRSLSLKR